MEYIYVVLLDYSTSEIVKIKLTEEECNESYEYDDFEEYLSTLEDKYHFRLSDCNWMVCENLYERKIGF